MKVLELSDAYFFPNPDTLDEKIKWQVVQALSFKTLVIACLRFRSANSRVVKYVGK